MLRPWEPSHSSNYLKGDYTKALELAERATTFIGSQVGSRELLWEIHTTVGPRLSLQNNLIEPVRRFKTPSPTSRVCASGRGRRPATTAVSLKNKISPYHEMIALPVDQGKPDEACLCRAGQARALLDVLRRGKADVTKAMTAKERVSRRRNH